MDGKKLEGWIDYFPLLAYLGFWLQGAALGAFITGEPRLVALGLVTVPAMSAMVAAALVVRKRRLDRPAD